MKTHGRRLTRPLLLACFSAPKGKCISAYDTRPSLANCGEYPAGLQAATPYLQVGIPDHVCKMPLIPIFLRDTESAGCRRIPCYRKDSKVDAVQRRRKYDRKFARLSISASYTRARSERRCGRHYLDLRWSSCLNCYSGCLCYCMPAT